MPGPTTRALLITSLVALVPVTTHCPSPESESEETLEISAVDLHRSFMEDASAARDSFGNKTLLISGEVAVAEARFRGTTMEGEVEVDPRISFKTELDTLPTDIKYVVVQGFFDNTDPDAPWTLDPRIQVGSTARVECSGSTIRWTDPGLYLSECRLAME